MGGKIGEFCYSLKLTRVWAEPNQYNAPEKTPMKSSKTAFMQHH